MKQMLKEAMACDYESDVVLLARAAKIDFDSQHYQVLERFTVILYDKASDLQHVDEARREMFCQDKVLEGLPPPGMHFCSTQSEQHIKLEYGAPVSIMNNTHLLQKVWAGLLMEIANHGFLYGTCYLGFKGMQ